MVLGRFDSGGDRCIEEGRYCSVSDFGKPLNEVDLALVHKCSYIHDKRGWNEVLKILKKICFPNFNTDCYGKPPKDAFVPEMNNNPLSKLYELQSFKNCLKPNFSKKSNSLKNYHILDEDYSQFIDQQPPYYPSLYINGALYKGPILSKIIAQAFCSNLTIKPEICREIDLSLPYISSKSSIKSFFGSLIIFTVVLFISACLSALLQFYFSRSKFSKSVKKTIDGYYTNLDTLRTARLQQRSPRKDKKRLEVQQLTKNHLTSTQTRSDLM